MITLRQKKKHICKTAGLNNLPWLFQVESSIWGLLTRTESEYHQNVPTPAFLPPLLDLHQQSEACLLYISGMSWAFHLVIATSHSDFSSLQFLMAFTICLLWWFCFFLSVDFKLGQNPFSFKSPGNCNPGRCVAAPRRRSGWYVWGDDVRAAEHQVWWTIGFFHGLLALEGIMYSLTSSSGFHLLPCCLELSPFQPGHHSSTNYLTSLAFFYLLEN